MDLSAARVLLSGSLMDRFGSAYPDDDAVLAAADPDPKEGDEVPTPRCLTEWSKGCGSDVGICPTTEGCETLHCDNSHGHPCQSVAPAACGAAN